MGADVTVADDDYLIASAVASVDCPVEHHQKRSAGDSIGP